MRTMHLFAGHGGGLLADLILGHKPIVAVEWDGYACQVLRERAADGWFPGLRVWEGDVRLFDPSEYTGGVDIIHAGFPCQDISVAGKQAGVSDGTRSGLYREVLRIAGVVRPKQLFMENVSAILSNGLGTVLGDLAALGYDCRWLCIRASDVGAPHHRDRWFLLANSERSTSVQQSELAMQRGWTDEAEQIGLGCGNVADPSGKCGNGSNDDPSIIMGQQTIPKSGNDCWTKNVANAYGAQRQGDQRQERNESQYADSCGSSWWEAEPAVGRVADGVPNRVHRLKGLGNAQVPLQAATAYRLLGGK